MGPWTIDTSWVVALAWAISWTMALRIIAGGQGGQIPFRWWLLAWGLRLVAGFGVMALYTLYYTDRSLADTWKYFDDAMTIRQWWNESPSRVLRFLLDWNLEDPAMQGFRDQLRGWNTGHTYGLPYDHRSMVRLHLVISAVTGGSYPAHVVFSAGMGWLGSWWTFRAFEPLFGKKSWMLWCAVALCPTLLFWSSGVLKEAPSWMGLGGLFLAVSRALRGLPLRKWIGPALAAGLWMAAFKPYVGICLVPSLLSLTAWHLAGRKYLLASFAAIHLLILLGSALPSPQAPGGTLVRLIQKKQQDFVNVAEERQSGSVILLPRIERPGDLLAHWPVAFVVTYLRPLPGELPGILMLLSSLENLIYLLLLPLLVVGLPRMNRTHWPWALMLLSFVMASALVIGLSVPVLGAVIRYRMAPLVCLVILCLIPWAGGLRLTSAPGGTKGDGAESGVTGEPRGR